MFFKNDEPSGSIRINVLNGIDADLNNVSNFKSALFHESIHALNYRKGVDDTPPLSHADVVLQQMQSSTFDNTTKNFKEHAAGYFGDFLKIASEYAFTQPSRVLGSFKKM